jgi:hypothetical protein
VVGNNLAEEFSGSCHRLFFKLFFTMASSVLQKINRNLETIGRLMSTTGHWSVVDFNLPIESRIGQKTFQETKTKSHQQDGVGGPSIGCVVVVILGFLVVLLFLLLQAELPHTCQSTKERSVERSPEGQEKATATKTPTQRLRQSGLGFRELNISLFARPGVFGDSDLALEILQQDQKQHMGKQRKGKGRSGDTRKQRKGKGQPAKRQERENKQRNGFC